MTSARTVLGTAVVAVAALAAGCGGDAKEAVDPAAIEGTWRYELSREYLLESGISERQARDESGVHTAVLRDGLFSDRWRTQEGRTGACSGKYVVEGSTVSFYWKEGCFGDWKMSPSVDGDTITWSDIETLDPNASKEDEEVNEVFNSVPWRRVRA